MSERIGRPGVVATFKQSAVVGIYANLAYIRVGREANLLAYDLHADAGIVEYTFNFRGGVDTSFFDALQICGRTEVAVGSIEFSVGDTDHKGMFSGFESSKRDTTCGDSLTGTPIIPFFPVILRSIHVDTVGLGIIDAIGFATYTSGSIDKRNFSIDIYEMLTTHVFFAILRRAMISQDEIDTGIFEIGVDIKAIGL